MKSIKEMRALTIVQPWAQCITDFGKNVENRSWSTNYRGYFAIHASQKREPARFENCRHSYRAKIDPEAVPYGAIIGFAELVDVINKKTLKRHTKKWFEGEHGFELANMIRLKKPVKVRGALNFWKLQGAELDEALMQLTDAQVKKISTNLLHNN